MTHRGQEYREATIEDVTVGTLWRKPTEYEKKGKGGASMRPYVIDPQMTSAWKENFLGAKWRNGKRIKYKSETVLEFQSRMEQIRKMFNSNKYYVRIDD